MDIMPIETIDDWEQRIDRQDAFWERAVIDRPVVSMTVPKYPAASSAQAASSAPAASTALAASTAPAADFAPATSTFPESSHGSLEERWTDAVYQAEYALAAVQAAIYLGDALPLAYPNLGPDFFCACFGGKLRYMEETSYVEPFLEDWSGYTDKIRFSSDRPIFSLMEDLYAAFLELGKGKFYTGWPDLHPGADCIVGFRGPLQMNFDVLEHPEEIRQALDDIRREFFAVYDHYYDKLTARGQAVTGWPGIVSRKKWHVPSNDFSCMISNELFEELFLDGLIAEMQHMDRNIYHLDGPGALRQLDSLLTVKELDAVQWVYGAGNGRASDHLDIYRKIQAAGKGIQIIEAYPDEIDAFMEHLSPEGVWMQVIADNEETAQAVLKKVSRWGAEK